MAGIQPFGMDPATVKAAQKANQKLARGEMAGTDNPFVSHRSGALDRVKVKEQEWGAMGHEYVQEGGAAADAGDAGDEAAYLASLSKKDRQLLAKYTKKLGGGAIDKKSKKHKKEKKHKKKHKKHKKKHKKSRGSSSSSSSST